jgi:hypothetical protein
MGLWQCSGLAGLPPGWRRQLLAVAQLLCTRLCQGGLLGAVLHQEVLPLLWAELRPALLPLLVQRLGLCRKHTQVLGNDASITASHVTCQ